MPSKQPLTIPRAYTPESPEDASRRGKAVTDRLILTVQNALFEALDFYETFGYLPELEVRTRVGLASPGIVSARVWFEPETKPAEPAEPLTEDQDFERVLALMKADPQSQEMGGFFMILMKFENGRDRWGGYHFNVPEQRTFDLTYWPSGTEHRLARYVQHNGGWLRRDED